MIIIVTMEIDMELPTYIETIIIVARVVVTASLAVLLVLGLQRAKLADDEKWAFGRRVVVVYIAWLTVILALGLKGAFMPGHAPVYAFPLALFGPIIVFSVVLLRAKQMHAILLALPVHWLIRLQVYRIIGGLFLVLYLQGFMPGEFALPAGIGDVAVGLLALYVAGKLAENFGKNRRLAIMWNGLGLFDLFIAVSMGFATAPGPFQMIAHDTPNLLVGLHPIILIPLFAVPSSAILHFLSLKQIALHAEVKKRGLRKQASVIREE